MSADRLLSTCGTEGITASSLRACACILTAGLMVILSLCCPASAQRPPEQKPPRTCNAAYLKNSVLVDGVKFRVYKNDKSGEKCLQIVQAGKLLFERTDDNDGAFTLGQQANKDGTIAAIPDGVDITGRGHADMIVTEWTGGAHCCRLDHVFELRPKVRLLAELHAQDADESHFADLDKDGRYYYVTADYTFAYWWGSFAGSPVHEVILRFVNDRNGGQYHLAFDKMARPAPSEAEWADALARVKGELDLNDTNMANNLAQVLWQEVMDFIYTGHSDLAWKLLKEVGPKAQQGGYPSLTDFCLTLKASPYWPDLRETMHGTPPACLNAKPGYK